MAGDKSVTSALHRLAILESQPFRDPNELLEWDRLRKWVLSDPDLLRQYQDQQYFSQMEEVTQNGYAPKNPSSLFSRFLDFILQR
jgi:hypothetical protein